MLKFYYRVKVKPNSKKGKVEKIDDFNYVVSVKELPIEGKANKAVIKSLAEFLRISPSQIKVISGLKSRQKIIVLRQTQYDPEQSRRIKVKNPPVRN